MKSNNLKKFVVWIFVALAIFFAFLVFSKTADATGRHNIWGKWSEWSKWSGCKTEDECGVGEGTQVRERNRECISVSGRGSDECDIKRSCAGYIVGDNWWCAKSKDEWKVDIGWTYTPETQTDEEVQKCIKELPICEEPKKDEPKGFSEDTRCLDAEPPVATWVEITDGSPANDWHPQATWAAEGGDSIGVRFGEDVDGNFMWSFEMDNDGHESLGFEHNTGLLGMIDYCYQFRTLNGCSDGDWSETVCAFN